VELLEGDHIGEIVVLSRKRLPGGLQLSHTRLRRGP